MPEEDKEEEVVVGSEGVCFCFWVILDLFLQIEFTHTHTHTQKQHVDWEAGRKMAQTDSEDEFQDELALAEFGELDF